MSKRTRREISHPQQSTKYLLNIIVKNGNVTLEGVVGSEMDKNMANVQANSVSGVFSVTNNLEVDKG